MDRACKDCKYCYGSEPNKLGKIWYECRKNPPQMLTDMDTPLHSAWPSVKANDWCGEFKKR